MNKDVRRIVLKELEELIKKERRTAFTISYLLKIRTGKKVTKRSVDNSLRLALLAVYASKLLVEVVEWGKRRVLRLRN